MDSIFSWLATNLDKVSKQVLFLLLMVCLLILSTLAVYVLKNHPDLARSRRIRKLQAEIESHDQADRLKLKGKEGYYCSLCAQEGDRRVLQRNNFCQTHKSFDTNLGAVPDWQDLS